MNTKLTLTLEGEVIRKAKEYAASNGRSLSEIVENHFRQITAPKNIDLANELTPRIKRLKGIIKLPDGVDYKQVIEEERMKKHG